MNRLFILFLIAFIFLSIIIWALIVRTKTNKSQPAPTQPISNIIDYKYNSELYEVENKNAENGIPYFLDQIQQIPGTLWQIRYFQPVFKSILVKDGAVFLETEIKNLANNNKKVLVFIGGKLRNKNYHFATFIKDGNEIPSENVLDKSDYFIKDKRVKIGYLQSADKSTIDFNSQLCRYATIYCERASLVADYYSEYLNFFKTGELRENMFIYALTLNNKLDEK